MDYIHNVKNVKRRLKRYGNKLPLAGQLKREKDIDGNKLLPVERLKREKEIDGRKDQLA